MTATFARYLAVQVAAYGVDMGGFLLCTSVLGWPPGWANVLAKAAAGMFAFACHRSFTFSGASAGSSHGQAVRYFAVLALNVPLSSGVLLLLLHWIPMAPAAKFAADVVVLAFTYWVSKRFVFKVHQPAEPTRGANP
jgi:putative flippase GtrA